MKPVETNMANYPNHTILIAIRGLNNISSIPVEVQNLPEDWDRRIFLAIRPEDALELGRQLCDTARSHPVDDREL